MRFFAITALAAVAAVVAAAPQALAQTVTFETKVPGYSNSGKDGWILIPPDANTGGRVVNSGKRNATTDRVMRGDQLRVTITGRRGANCQIGEDAIVGVLADNGFARGSVVTLPFSRDFTVSKDPSFDNVTAIVITFRADGGKVVKRRVPIGTR